MSPCNLCIVDYDIIYFGRGLVGAYYLRTAPEGSSMRWLYDNKIKGKEDQFEYTRYECIQFTKPLP